MNFGRWGNPVMRRVVRRTDKGEYVATGENVATMKGMILKSAFMCVLTIVAGVLTALLTKGVVANALEGVQNDALNSAFTAVVLIAVGSMLPLFIFPMIIFFAPRTAGVLGSVCCALQGVLLGLVSGLVDYYFPGVALVAFLATGLVFLITLVIFRALGERVSGKFTRFVMISLISLVLVTIVVNLLCLIPSVAALFANPWISIGISAVTILLATFTLLVDMDSMKHMADAQVAKTYEWLGAYALTTTLIWLYMEILELLLRILSVVNRK